SPLLVSPHSQSHAHKYMAPSHPPAPPCVPSPTAQSTARPDPKTSGPHPPAPATQTPRDKTAPNHPHPPPESPDTSAPQAEPTPHQLCYPHYSYHNITTAPTPCRDPTSNNQKRR